MFILIALLQMANYYSAKIGQFHLWPIRNEGEERYEK